MKAIYFDTNTFYKIGFNMDDEVFEDVMSLAKSLKIKPWTTKITIQEVVAGINKKFDAFNDSLQAISKLCETVEADDDDISGFNFEKLEEKQCLIIEDIESFFGQNFELIPFDVMDDADIAKVFNDYFTSTKPFGPLKKKAEFPDAFQLELIKRKLLTTEKAMIVSSDGDFSNIGANFIIVKSLEQARKELLNKWKTLQLNDYKEFCLNEIVPDMSVDRLLSECKSNNYVLTQTMLNEVLLSLRDDGCIKLKIGDDEEYRGSDKTQFFNAIINKVRTAN